MAVQYAAFVTAVILGLGELLNLIRIGFDLVIPQRSPWEEGERFTFTDKKPINLDRLFVNRFDASRGPGTPGHVQQTVSG
jgi:hypothetical protein